MRFVVDVNSDLDPGQENYNGEFFRDLISVKSHRVVIGGTKMADEIKRKRPLMRLINQLSSAGKLDVLPRCDVDSLEVRIANEIIEKFGSCPSECDDQHIFAVCIIGNVFYIIGRDVRIKSCYRKVSGCVSSRYVPRVRVITSASVYCSARKRGFPAG